METSLKTGFAQVFSCFPKNLSCPNFGGAAAPLAPPARTPMNVDGTVNTTLPCWSSTHTLLRVAKGKSWSSFAYTFWQILPITLVKITQQIQQLPQMGKTEEDWNRLQLRVFETVQPNSFSKLISAVCSFQNNAQETDLFVSNLWFCHFHVISLLTLSSIAIECE